MRVIVLLPALLMAGMALTTIHARSAECLENTLHLVGWSAKVYEHGPLGRETSVTLGLQNLAEKDIVMVEGTATFVDALGNIVAPFPAQLDADVNVPAGTAGVTSNISVTDNEARLATIAKDLVTPSLCITAVVFADRTVLRASAE